MSLLRNKKFLSVYAATAISNLGDGVGSVAYPWLASAVTRNPVLIALVIVAQRLPWLVFTLPAGVITDRVDRRKAMVAMDGVRCALTVVVAVAVFAHRTHLPRPGHIPDVMGTRTGLYAILLVATLLLGMAEVLRDNASQTIVPAIVEPDALEKANGRMWGIEGIMNTFLGPPLGALLIGIAFALPFLVDAGSFLAAAALVAIIPGTFRATRSEPSKGDVLPDEANRSSWRDELREGVRWLWGHELLRPMAIILGLMNAAGVVSGATFVLFAQEVMHTSPLVFSILGFGGALGGIVAGQFASAASKRFGSGTCLTITLVGGVVLSVLIGSIALWPVVLVLFALEMMLGMLWNVITVSLRQSIIPEHLLGRVNSVYRFFAWGMMPIGAAIGGLTVLVVDTFASRGMALRATWFVNAAIHLVLFVMGRRYLTTDKIEAARAEVS